MTGVFTAMCVSDAFDDLPMLLRTHVDRPPLYPNIIILISGWACGLWAPPALASAHLIMPIT